MSSLSGLLELVHALDAKHQEMAMNILKEHKDYPLLLQCMQEKTANNAAAAAARKAQDADQQEEMERLKLAKLSLEERGALRRQAEQDDPAPPRAGWVGAYSESWG